MALSPTLAWKRAMQRKTPRLRFLATIDDGTNQWKALSGSCDQFRYPNGLYMPSSVGAETDPYTRETEIGETVVDFKDKWIRPIFVNNRIKGQSLEVKIGAKEIQESDFIYYSGGIIDDILGDGEGKVVTVSALDALAVLRDKEITGAWFGKHPLEVIYYGDGTGIIELAGLPTSLIDTTSLDPSQAQYSDISHWNMIRGGWHEHNGQLSVTSATSALELIQELGQILQGSFVINEEGKLSFVRYDPTAPVVGAWTSKEIRKFSTVALEEQMINESIVRFHQKADGKTRHWWTDEDTDSQSSHAYKGSGTRKITEEIETKWLNAWGRLKDDLIDTDTQLEVLAELTVGLCGNRGGHLSPQPAEAQLNASRPAYLLIIALINNKWEHEIVKSTSATPLSVIGQGQRFTTRDPATGDQIVVGPFNNVIRYSNLTRGLFGTAPSALTPKLNAVYDVTIPVYVTQAIIERFGNGVGIVEIETGFGEFDKQIGDPMALSDLHYIAFGKDGITSSDKWEIIKKEPSPDSFPPQITWRLAWGGITTPARSYRMVPGADDVEADRATSLEKTDVMRSFVFGGLALVSPTGLQATIDAGGVSSYPSRGLLENDLVHTFAASKDTWVSYNTRSRSFGFYAEPTGSPEPEKSPNEIWVWKVETDATSITATTDLRETLPIPGSVLDGGSGPLTYLVNDGVFTDFDKVNDGAVYLKVQGVDGSNQCTSDSIADDEVGLANLDRDQEYGNWANTNVAGTMLTRG